MVTFAGSGKTFKGFIAWFQRDERTQGTCVYFGRLLVERRVVVCEFVYCSVRFLLEALCLGKLFHRFTLAHVDVGDFVRVSTYMEEIVNNIQS